MWSNCFPLRIELSLHCLRVSLKFPPFGLGSSWVSNSKLSTLIAFSWTFLYLDYLRRLKAGLRREGRAAVICMLMHLNGKLSLVNAKDLCSSSYTLWRVECSRKYWISSDRISLFMWQSKGIMRALYRRNTMASFVSWLVWIFCSRSRGTAQS